MGKIILVICLLFAPICYAEPSNQQEAGRWFDEWWNTTYEEKIEPVQREQLNQRTKTKCERKVEYYERKTRQDPTSSWWKWKYNTWKEQCDRELNRSR